MVTSDFLKQVLATKKKLLKMSEVRVCNPPKYDEISVKNLYDRCIQLPGMKDYFPVSYAKGKRCQREYFFSVLNTLYPDETIKIIVNAKQARVPGQSEDDKHNTIQISNEWKEALLMFPQFSSKFIIHH